MLYHFLMIKSLGNNQVFLLLREVTDGLPVVVMDSKPLTVSRSNVNVHGAEIVILLVTYKQEKEQRIITLSMATLPN